MKYSIKQLIKIVLAITVLLASSVLIYNKKNISNKLAIVTQDKNSGFKQIKYASGSEIHETSINDGEEHNDSLIIKKEKGLLFNNKIDLNLVDKAKPNNIENIDTKVLEDNMIISFEKPQDNGTTYEYTVKNNNKEKNLSFYAKSDIKGYSYIIDECNSNESKQEINKFDNAPILETKLDWSKDYYLHIRTFDNNGNYSKNKTFKLDLPSEGVIIRYIDMNTGDDIETKELIKGVAKQKYNCLNMKKELDGYQLLKTEGPTEGILQKDCINVSYEYAKNAKVKVNYIDKETGKELSEPTYIEGYEGKQIEVNAKEIYGYNYNTKTINTKMQAGLNNINIYYTEIPKGIINVKYIDKDTNNEIAEKEIINDYINNRYDTASKEIQGYKLEHIPDNANGYISSDEMDVIYYYKSNAITETKENKEKELKIKNIEGYKLMEINDFDDNKSIIDELIDSLDDNKSFIQKEENNNKVIIPKKTNSDIKTEYEIVMNCDDSDYIIYYKK